MNDNRSSYFNGNTVFAPVPQEIPETYESKKLKEQKKQLIIKENKKRAKKNRKAVSKVVFMCLAGLFIVYRYASIYKMEANIASLGTEINNMNYDSENMYLELLKYNNIEYIQDTALNKLHMSMPEKSTVESANLKKNNFNEENNTTNKKSVIQIIKDKLF